MNIYHESSNSHNIILSKFESLCLNYDLNIFAQTMMPYLTILDDLINLSKVTKAMRKLIYSHDMREVWNRDPIDICIDSRCYFGCGRVQMTPISSNMLLSQAPIEYLRMHLPFDRLGQVLKSILMKGTMRRLHLRFRADDVNYARVLSDISKLKSSSNEHSDNLEISHLTIFGWPSFTNNFSGTIDSLKMEICGQFLELIGKKLVSVQLMESSPPGLLHIIRCHCQQLSFLSLEGAQPSHDINNLDMQSLQVLCLHNVGVRIFGIISLPNLKRFEYIDIDVCSLYLSTDDVHDMASSIPETIKELEIRYESYFAFTLMNAITSRLKRLESFTLHVAESSVLHDEADQPNNPLDSLRNFSIGCSRLTVFELLDGTLDFSSDALEVLADFQHLQRIKMFYDKSIISVLDKVLKRSTSIEEVALYANAGEMFTETESLDGWREIEEAMQSLSEKYPSVVIGLSDSWWT